MRPTNRVTATWVLPLLALAFLTAAGAGPPKTKAKGKVQAEPPIPLPPLNARVLDFARGQLGKSVGNGECTSLAIAALRSAGARRFPFEGDGNFVWGRPVASFREALPGDLVQFRDATFQGKTWVTRRRWVSWSYTYPHHTAIVAGVAEGGKRVTLLHQNVGPETATEDEKRTVQEQTLRVDSLQAGGRVWIYRPISLDEATDEAQKAPECRLPLEGDEDVHIAFRVVVAPSHRAEDGPRRDPVLLL